MSEQVRYEDGRIAWVETPSEEIIRQYMGKGHPYDFGFQPRMSMLISSHMRIAPFFGQLFREIMFSEKGALDRREREMVAAVSSAAQDCHY